MKNDLNKLNEKTVILQSNLNVSKNLKSAKIFYPLVAVLPVVAAAVVMKQIMN